VTSVRILAAAGLALCGAQALAAPADYAVQMGSSYQYQSNPARRPDSASDIQGTGAWVKSAGLGLRLPLLSEDTRLDAGGTLSDVRYSNQRQLDHQPRNLQSTLYWRAGPLFAGRFDYGYSKQLNSDLNRSWPERDQQTRQNRSAEIGLRITDRLTLPAVSVFSNATGYDQDINQTLYNREERGWQAAARYAGFGRSFAQAGWRQTHVDYYKRTPALTATIDDRYADNEAFVAARWDYSPKTLFQGRVGLLARSYEHLSERDTHLLTFDGRATWDYSPKTRVDLQLWHRPYAYDDDPQVLYGVRTGGGVSLTWQPTVKTAFSLGLEHSRQRNTALVGANEETLQIQRLGARVQWLSDDNLRWVMDLYRDRQRGANQQDSYSQNFVRIGIEYTFGSGSKDSLRRMMQPTDCLWRRPEVPLCDPIREEP
ncbi:putative capsular polysaccharide biosynthesis protein, partial [Bordetella avium 197N]